jgi:hypothetical protein
MVAFGKSCTNATGTWPAKPVRTKISIHIYQKRSGREVGGTAESGGWAVILLWLHMWLDLYVYMYLQL